MEELASPSNLEDIGIEGNLDYIIYLNLHMHMKRS